jgi:hypothetical protein
VKAGLGVDDHDDDVGCIGGSLGLAASGIGELDVSTRLKVRPRQSASA